MRELPMRVLTTIINYQFSIIMAVKYRLVQNTRKESEQYGLWYGRASYDKQDTINIEQLADKIAYATTVTDVDAEAVIKALCRFMREALLEGKKVLLDKFGTFKVGLHTAPAKSAKEFNANVNVKGARVIFQPAVEKDKVTGKFVKKLISGIQVVEKSMYHVDKGEDETPDVQPEP